jgi:hypothetical protein
MQTIFSFLEHKD